MKQNSKHIIIVGGDTAGPAQSLIIEASNGSNGTAKTKRIASKMTAKFRQ